MADNPELKAAKDDLIEVLSRITYTTIAEDLFAAIDDYIEAKICDNDDKLKAWLARRQIT